MARTPGRSWRGPIGTLVRTAAVAALALGVSLAPGAVASADVVEPLELTYSEPLYGDFIHIGNGVMVCPPGSSPFTSVPCADGQNRTNTQALNDRYDMQWNDPDGGGPRFNGSSGELTIPAGATVAYAQLSWSGATGVLRDAGGGQLHSPATGDAACGSYQRGSGAWATVPPGTPQSQSVFLSVDGGPTAALPPVGLVMEPTPAAAGAQYYSAHAEVTGHFTSAPTGAPVTVDVADVWTPEGYNCFGGWSLTLVYSYPEPQATHAPHLRQVYVYTGHVRQNPGDPDTETFIDGFVYAGGDIRLGITAYEGNWGIPGDYFEINGTRLAEPQIGGTSNFFISATDGSVSPDVPNNYSVDAKTMDIDESQGLIPLDAVSADLAFGTTGDAYMAQLLVFSVPVAELRVDKEVCHSAEPADCGPGGSGPWEKHTAVPLGETAYWRVTVTNPSRLDISDATLADAAEPGCAEAAGSFDVAAGESVSFYCATEDVTTSSTNAVTVSFVPPGAPPGTPPTVSPPSEAAADPYGMSVMKEVCQATAADDCGPGGTGPWATRGAVRTGDTAYWRITVANLGALPLRDVVLEDRVEPSCAEAVGEFNLPAGETRHFLCATQNVMPPLVNAVTLTAPAPSQAPPDAPPLVATAQAEVPGLANTGSGATVPLLVVGAGLIAAGVVVVVLVRLFRRPSPRR